MGLARGDVGVVVWGFEAGFETPDLAVIGEQDILGDRLVRPKRAPSARRISWPRSRR
jgi:transcription-repair coupling factor (superfamily II helicase)